MNKFKFAVISAVVALGLFSCNENDYDYIAGAPNAGNVNIGFASAGKATLAISDSEYAITMSRKEATGEVVVPINVISAPSFVTVPSSVTFAAGQNEASLVLKIAEGMAPYQNYLVELSIPEEFSAVYADDAMPINFSLKLSKEDFEKAASCEFTSTVALTGTWPVDLEYSEYLDLFRMQSLYEDGYDYYFHFSYDESGKQVFYFTDNAGNKVDKTPTGYMHPSYGLISSTFSYGVEMGYDEEENYFYWTWKMTVDAGSFGEKKQYLDVLEWIKKPW